METLRNPLLGTTTIQGRMKQHSLFFLLYLITLVQFVALNCVYAKCVLFSQFSSKQQVMTLMFNPSLSLRPLSLSLSLTLFLKKLNSSQILQVRLLPFLTQYFKKVLLPRGKNRETKGLQEKSEIKLLCKRRFLHFHLNLFKKQQYSAYFVTKCTAVIYLSVRKCVFSVFYCSVQHFSSLAIYFTFSTVKPKNH